MRASVRGCPKRTSPRLFPLPVLWLASLRVAGGCCSDNEVSESGTVHFWQCFLAKEEEDDEDEDDEDEDDDEDDDEDEDDEEEETGIDTSDKEEEQDSEEGKHSLRVSCSLSLALVS